MATVTIDEIVNTVNAMTPGDREEIRRRLDKTQLFDRERKVTAKTVRRGYVSPNTIWMRDHSAPYGGQYVALENGELVATGKGFPDTMAKAREAGAVRPLVAYVPRADEELFTGGWE